MKETGIEAGVEKTQMSGKDRASRTKREDVREER